MEWIAAGALLAVGVFGGFVIRGWFDANGRMPPWR